MHWGLALGSMAEPQSLLASFPQILPRRLLCVESSCIMVKGRQADL